MSEETVDSISRRELILAAGRGYESSSTLSWEHLIDEEGKLLGRGLAGDALVDFVILEIGETYDEEASREDQIAEAARVIESAEGQLNDVRFALENME